MYQMLSEEQKKTAIDNLIKNLAALRTMLHLTQAQFAELMGVTRQTLVRYETGKGTMPWNTFLSFLFVFIQRTETRDLLIILGIYKKELQAVYQDLAHRDKELA